MRHLLCVFVLKNYVENNEILVLYISELLRILGNLWSEAYLEEWHSLHCLSSLA